MFSAFTQLFPDAKMSHMKEASTTKLLERLVERLSGSLSVETARDVLSLKIDRPTQRRLDALADKGSDGQLTPGEQAEYASLVVGLDLLTLMQARARALLAGRRDAR
jgi:hypothetical protein